MSNTQLTLNTPLTNKQYGIILLEGTATIGGQIEACKLGIKECDKNTDECTPYAVKGWRDSHIETLKKLYALLEG